MMDVAIGLVTLAAVLLATRWFRLRIPPPEAPGLDDGEGWKPTAPGPTGALPGAGAGGPRSPATSPASPRRGQPAWRASPGPPGRMAGAGR